MYNSKLRINYCSFSSRLDPFSPSTVSRPPRHSNLKYSKQGCRQVLVLMSKIYTTSNKQINNKGKVDDTNIIAELYSRINLIETKALILTDFYKKTVTSLLYNTDHMP